MSTRPVITLTTDFGLESTFVGEMKGAILGIHPDVAIVDLTHSIPAFDIRKAAWTIGTSCTAFPHHTIHVAVVDPGVGSFRRPLLVTAAGHRFIGPDNGIFSLIYAKEKASVKVFHLTNERYFLRRESPTFQGRDLFAPAAAWLSRGMPVESFGPEVGDAVTIPLPLPKSDGRSILGEVVEIDRFGNAITNIGIDDLGHPADRDRLVVTVMGTAIPLKPHYAAAGEGVVACLFNSSGFLEIFVNRASAAESMGIAVGSPAAVSLI